MRKARGERWIGGSGGAQEHEQQYSNKGDTQARERVRNPPARRKRHEDQRDGSRGDRCCATGGSGGAGIRLQAPSNSLPTRAETTTPKLHCALPTAACVPVRLYAEKSGGVVRVGERRRRAGRPGRCRGAGLGSGDRWRRADAAPLTQRPARRRETAGGYLARDQQRGPSCSSVGGLAPSPLSARAEVSPRDGLSTKPQATQVTEACNPRSNRHSRVLYCID